MEYYAIRRPDVVMVIRQSEATSNAAAHPTFFTNDGWRVGSFGYPIELRGWSAAFYSELGEASSSLDTRPVSCSYDLRCWQAPREPSTVKQPARWGWLAPLMLRSKAASLVRGLTQESCR